jgi:hypothetical protein
MSACLLIAGKPLWLAASLFQLSWSHSVERVEWVEQWRLAGGRLLLEEARVKGSGAGMEPGPEARLQDGWWVWHPRRSHERLVLAASGATTGGWTFCADGQCRALGDQSGAPVVIELCP